VNATYGSCNTYTHIISLLHDDIILCARDMWLGWLRWCSNSDALQLIQTRHRASTSTRWHFASTLCCHSIAIRAPIADPPNSAQLGGTPYHSPSYIRVRLVVWACVRGQTDIQTYRQTRVTTRPIHFSSSTRNVTMYCIRCFQNVLSRCTAVDMTEFLPIDLGR